MPSSVQSQMRSSRRYLPLKLQRKYGPSSRTYEGTKAVKDSKFQRLTMSFEEIKIEEDESFDEFYAKLKDIVNSAFNLGKTIPEPKIVRKLLRSLPERFDAKIIAIEESKDMDKIPLIELVGNLQIYELGLTRIGKSSKRIRMALKVKSSDIDESLDNEDFKMKSYITRKFKKFMKNANGKGFDKDHKQSSSSQFKNQDKRKKDTRDGGLYTIPSEPKCFGCQGFGHMKQECLTYLKTIGKSKALAATLSDFELEDDSENEDDGILNAFIATINPTIGIVEDVDDEEDLVDSKFEKMDDQDDIHTAYEKLYKVSEKYEKLYRLATKKLSDVEFDHQSFPRSLMKQIRPLEHCDLRIISWLRRPRNLRQSCSKSELSWKGLQVQILRRCSAFRNLLSIKPV